MVILNKRYNLYKGFLRHTKLLFELRFIQLIHVEIENVWRQSIGVSCDVAVCFHLLLPVEHFQNLFVRLTCPFAFSVPFRTHTILKGKIQSVADVETPRVRLLVKGACGIVETQASESGAFFDPCTSYFGLDRFLGPE
ncbi:hypothetical protein PsorP6_011346 [Peronosclerospora sorghi]|uniref:Uncharacterized protein n=1 Tax=Peronosclerospora sorghi TaxID=230839 RepID=A0ACC0WHT5_9STRA|nr:hypothetical protein PsorP6_011346 [Peronosclerospora sorghi]